MRKIVIHRAGSYDQLRIESHPSPRPGPGEVRIVVRAAGVNYADCIVRMGLYASAREYVGWPITPGFEVAGVVESLGTGVEDLSAGSPVMAVTRFGGYAEELVVPRHQVFPLPPGLSLEQAAAFPAVHLTADYALCELVRLRPGLQALVHSAAGGVGGALLQILRLHGCPGVGIVGGPQKRDAALAQGARAVIDKSREPLWTTAERLSPGGYDLILDANGAATLRQSYRHLAPAGRLVVYGFHTMLPRSGGRPSYLKLASTYLQTPWFSPLDLCNDNKSLLAFNLSYLFERRDLLAEGMTRLSRWLAEGKLHAPPLTSFPFDRVAEAHRALESGATVGKLVLVT